MNWKEFTQHCRLDSTAGEADCAVSALESLGLIRVQGDDAHDFLQGQLTNDISAVSPNQGQLSAWCTPKGRMLALMFVFQRNGDLYLQLPREQLDTVLKRLRMFIMRSKVTVEDVSNELSILAMGGDCLSQLLENTPRDNFACTQDAAISLIRFPGDVPRFQAIAPPEELASLLEKALSIATVVKEQWWTLQNIRNAVPELGSKTTEAFIPQMLNLDLLNGISFTKGCYTGQEVVARMKYLGQLKRRMYIGHVDSDEPIVSGDKLFSPHSQSAQGAGKIVAAVNTTGNHWETLLVTEISTADQGDIQHRDDKGAVIKLSEPPYGLSGAE